MEKLKSEVRAELFNILDFWQREMLDTLNGGFKGKIDAFGREDVEATKGSVLNTRILWTFSAACNVLKTKKYEETATRAYEYLANYFFDKECGGVYWELDATGNPVNTKKQVYAQAFAIYALSEYYKLTKNEATKQQAIALFELLERHSFDPEHNGYLEAYSREWKLLEDLRLSDKDANEKMTMNTHLHVLEGYTTLLEIWDNDRLRSQLKNLVRIHLDKILDKSTYHLNLFFDEKWELKSTEYSFGHDIEAAWLLHEAAKVLGDKALLKEVAEAAVNIARVTLEEGLDIDGGLFNEGDHGRITDPDKHWWPQAEALVGFYDAYQISNEGVFRDAALRVWDFTKRNIIDRRGGEWHFRVNRRGEPYKDEDKAGFWKCPYHNSRACLEVLKR